ncbi:MAG: sigma factor [Ferruginibacter sp.]
MTASQLHNNIDLDFLKSKKKIAFNFLFDTYGASINGIVKRIIQDDATTEKLFKDIFVNAWNDIENFDSEKTTLFCWLICITRNTIQKNAIPLPSVDGGSFPKIIDLSFGFSKTRIAQALTVTESKVNSLLRNAMLQAEKVP